MRHFLFSLTLFFVLVVPVFSDPVVFEHHRPGSGNTYPIKRNVGDPFPDIFIPSLGSKADELQENTTTLDAGYVAVRYDHIWRVRQVTVTVQRSGEFSVYFDAQQFAVISEAIAYPIDPLMERSDIEGATIIKLNADSTAWVFQHAEIEEHYDRELAIQAAIVGAFQRTLDDANLDIIRHRKNNAVQVAKILTYGRLIEFRNDWIGYALIAEQRKHIGHHVQDQTYIHECVIDSFNDAIKEWKKNKADAWTPIRYQVETVAKRRITTLHDYKEPWNHPTRQVIRNLKKAKEAAAETETESSGDSNGE